VVDDPNPLPMRRGSWVEPPQTNLDMVWGFRVCPMERVCVSKKVGGEA
jgi:hypothetical protein